MKQYLKMVSKPLALLNVLRVAMVGDRKVSKTTMQAREIRKVCPDVEVRKIADLVGKEGVNTFADVLTILKIDMKMHGDDFESFDGRLYELIVELRKTFDK